MMAQPIGDSAVLFEAVGFLDQDDVTQSGNEIEDVWVFLLIILAWICQISWAFPLASQEILLAWDAARVNSNDVYPLPVSRVKDVLLPA